MSVRIIAEIGLNHNGDMWLAKRLIDAAAFAGADAVKFQKRTPELCVPKDQWDVPRETPWGTMRYIDYRHRMEFGEAQYAEIAEYCDRATVNWTASAWDLPSAEFLQQRMARRWVKLPSAKITDLSLVNACALMFPHVILSTGMSTDAEVAGAVGMASPAKRLTVLHCHSAYPAPSEELNLRAIQTLALRFPWAEVGYSGHEYGIRHVLAAVALGATTIERHITLDHEMWGTDQKASIEPLAFSEMVRHVRSLEVALGDGVRRVWPSEEPARRKLRGVDRSREAA